MPETWLITGATGLMGSHLIRLLQDQAYKGTQIDSTPNDMEEEDGSGVSREIHALHHTYDSDTPLHRMSDPSRVTEHITDITDAAAVHREITQINPDIIVHLAAMATVGECDQNPVGAQRVNHDGTAHVLEAVRQSCPDARVIVASTDKVYGEGYDAAVGDTLIPTDAYSSSKISADVLTQAYRGHYDLDTIVYRACNIYGYEPGGGRIISNTILDCLHGDDPLVFDDIRGIREYIYADDVARAITMLAVTANPYPVYNIGSGDVITQEGVVERILKAGGFGELGMRRERKNEGETIAYQSLESTTISGWKPKHSFQRGIEQTINDFKYYGYPDQ